MVALPAKKCGIIISTYLPTYLPRHLPGQILSQQYLTRWYRIAVGGLRCDNDVVDLGDHVLNRLLVYCLHIGPCCNFLAG